MITTDSPAISTEYVTPCRTSYGHRGARAEWHWEPRSWPIYTRNRRGARREPVLDLLDRRPAGLRTPPSALNRSKNRFDFHIGKTHEGGPTTNVESLLQFSVIPRFPARQLCAQEKIKGLPHSRPNSIPVALPWALRRRM